MKTSDHIWFVNEKIIYTKQFEKNLAEKLNRFDTISLFIVFFIGAVISLRKIFLIAIL